ncbi:ABC transporter ATP-binding protein [Sinorhizobium sp. BG8]|uniref:ABC transporter ATP-binding protein n=1 Tax=Sinorhizobium sp. BG8 TaxID=2613773 RepID=UPI00193D14C8|nr:ABC transporter ATP-binding protein [Sinorhizobium sp. BG8]QRM56319.1 ABC transporter ATP-binding protein [Sinorhizobium sp. BG8]
MTTLQLDNIVKRYKSQTVLDHLSLDVKNGETLVLFGPSGAGKSVLLRLVAGVIEPDEGKVLIGGEDMTDVDAEHRGIGMAFQNFALFPHMDAFDNIASPLTAAHSTTDAIKDGVARVAKLLKIDHVLSHHPKALSNGQKQRTALARALVGSPPLLLLDDPLRNVDAKLRFEMRLELPRLLAAQGATVVYVTQDYKEAMALGDRIAVMAEGRIRQIGTPQEIYNTPADIEIARLFGDPTVNLLDVTPKAEADGVSVQLSDIRIPLPGIPATAAGKPAVLGLRPEILRFVDAATPGAIPVTVEAETPLNEKTVTLVLTVRKREILVSRPAGTPGPVSGPAHVAVDGSHAFLFDKETGLLIGRKDTNRGAKGEAA